MGEKGIASDALGVVEGTSLVERTTTVVTSALGDAGKAAATAAQDQVVGAAVDHTIAVTRARLTGDDAEAAGDGDERDEEANGAGAP